MGLFNFFKKKKPEKIEILEKDLPIWISNKNKELDQSKEEIFTVIKSRILKLNEEIASDINNLRNIDLENKNLGKRITSMAKSNLENYISYLNKLSEKLLEINSLENLIEKINSTIHEFELKSNLNYQKIAYVSGKEAKQTKNTIKLFLSDIEEILKSNKEILDKSQSIKKIKKELDNLRKVENEEKELENQLKENSKEIEILIKELKIAKDSLEEFKNSKEYLEYKNKIKQLESLEIEYEKLKILLGSKIDFKSMSNFYHKFDKEMQLVKKYREDIKNSINQYGTEKLNSYLDESNLNSKEISLIINSVNEKQNQIKEFDIKFISKEPYENKIKSINLEIENLEIEINSNKKKIEGLQKEHPLTKNKLTEELDNFNISLQD